MVDINIVVPIQYSYSFNLCAKILRDFIHTNISDDLFIRISRKPIDGTLNILINELMNSIVNNIKAQIWWLDTPFLQLRPYQSKYLENIKNNAPYDTLILTSNKLKEYYEDLYELECDGVIGRLIEDYLFNQNINTQNQYDIGFIGNLHSDDTKNCYLIKKLLSDKEYINKYSYYIITDIRLPKLGNVKHIDYGKLKGKDKLEFFKSIKYLLFPSKVEGFGMPVLEAMACGKPVIYSDVPSHNEFAVGVEIPYTDKIETYRYGFKGIKYNIDYNDLVESIEYAFSIPEKQYKKLCEKAYNKALEIQNENKEKMKKLIESYL